MDAACRDEVVELHRFFEDWFNGRLEPTDESFARLGGVVADGFQIIFPNGQIIDRDALLGRVRAAHGAHASKEKQIRIWIDAYRSRPIDEGLQLVTYEEWQRIGRSSRGRRVTAVLRAKEGNPNGVEWLHVHEVWLPSGNEI